MNKKQIKYGIVAEDKANSLFMQHIVPQIMSNFEVILRGVKIAGGVGNVNSNFINLANKLLDEDETLDLIVVARDQDLAISMSSQTERTYRFYDDEFKQELLSMKKKVIDEGGQNNILIISIAVQAIEFWMRYIKNPIEEKIENKYNRKECKKFIYKDNFKKSEKEESIIKKLLQNVDIKGLKEKSVSFSTFVEDLTHLSNNLSDVPKN